MTEEVDATHHLTYRVILPPLVFLGIVANGLCIITLSRPALRAARVNGYFLTLAVSDLLVCVFHIPVITSITGCTFSSYTEAFYFTHFGWTLLGISQALGTYTIVWLSFDRFVAIWFYDLYPRIQQKPTMRRRLLVTALLCVLFHLFIIVDGRVYCSVQDDDELCTAGKWVSVTGYENHFHTAWHKVYLGVFGMFIRWIPCCLLLLFNLGLVIGVVRGRITFPGTQEFGKGGEKTLIATTIAITATYILFTFPITVYIMGYNTHLEDRCTGGYAKEVLRAVGNVFQLLEHIIHILFFIGLYKGFRRELKILLFLEKREVEPGAAHKERHVNPSQCGGLELPGCHTHSSLTPDRHSIRPTIVEVI